MAFGSLRSPSGVASGIGTSSYLSLTTTTFRSHFPLYQRNTGRTLNSQLNVPFFLSYAARPVSGSIGIGLMFWPASDQYHSVLVETALAIAGIWQLVHARRSCQLAKKSVCSDAVPS